MLEPPKAPLSALPSSLASPASTLVPVNVEATGSELLLERRVEPAAGSAPVAAHVATVDVELALCPT